MSKLDPSVRLLHLMLRAQHHARKESSDTGYAMMLVSILTILIFSLLAAYLTMTNISKSATNASIEANSTFYAAESGLNQRSDAVRQKFINYATPEGVSPGAVPGSIAGPSNMAFCLDSDPLADKGSGDFACQKAEYNYKHAIGTSVSTGADGKSLSASDYANNVKYTAYSFVSDRTIYIDPVRKIPQVQAIPAGQAYAGLNAQEYRYTIYSMATSKQPENLDARAMTVLEMTFKSRSIPLFQFAAFYDGDLEMNSTSQMDINGRVHTNSNLFVQPTTGGATPTTRLLGQVTAANSIYNRVDASTNTNTGITQVLLSGDPNNLSDPTNVYTNFPPTALASRFSPLTSTEIATFNRKVLDGSAGASVLQIPLPGFLRKRDASGGIGEYYGKADLRLEMVPKRAAGNVPFNFMSIKDGGSGGSCTGFDISTGRQGTSLKCTRLTEGQLRSLQQPVMAKVVTDEERARLCPSVTVNHNPSTHNERKILRALQVGILSQNTPVPLNQLDLPLSDPANASISSIATGLKSLDTSKSPAQLAAEVGGCFLPAPIQVLTGSGVVNSNYNWQSSYFDRREQRWIGMLQSNIASLTVWNRDGLYVDRDNDITTNDDTTTTQQTAAYNSGNNGSIYDTDSVLFNRAAAKPTASTGSFQKLGLAAADTTEGGLVYHATVSDDLDGDGTDDLTVDSADNLRNYADGKKKSSYGFAFSGGENLPGPLTVVTDRGLYVQGDYNNFNSSAAKQPAALIGDTIAVLSNNCVDANTKMLNCGVTTATQNAIETTVNAAFLSYTDRSNGNIGSSGYPTAKEYSGGLNNYMRMVENWGGQKFNYTGSFVSLGAPQEYSGAYIGGSATNNAFTPGDNYYNIPIRNFRYDGDFNAFDRLPPLTPKVIYLQQETFKRSF
jgi:hypothetical protein